MATKATIRIPGTKTKIPRTLAVAGGVGIVAALVLMRGREDEDESSGQIPTGILAQEIAGRLADQESAFFGAIEDINQQLDELREERLEDDFSTLPYFPSPGDDKPPPPPPPAGSYTQPETSTASFVDLSDVETPADVTRWGGLDILRDLFEGYAGPANYKPWGAGSQAEADEIGAALRDAYASPQTTASITRTEDRRSSSSRPAPASSYRAFGAGSKQEESEIALILGDAYAPKQSTTKTSSDTSRPNRRFSAL